MKQFGIAFCAMVAIHAANAQTAQPVLPGYLSTTGCGTGTSPCFFQSNGPATYAPLAVSSIPAGTAATIAGSGSTTISKGVYFSSSCALEVAIVSTGAATAASFAVTANTAYYTPFAPISTQYVSVFNNTSLSCPISGQVY